MMINDKEIVAIYLYMNYPYDWRYTGYQGLIARNGYVAQYTESHTYT